MMYAIYNCDHLNCNGGSCNLFLYIFFNKGGIFLNKPNLNKKDPRFKIANREALVGIGLVLFNFIWWYGFAYGLGSQDVNEYNYVFGFPAWFFYSCIIGVTIMAILVFIMVKFFFVDVSFDEEGFEDK